MTQVFIVGIIVGACAASATWRLMPVGWQRGLRHWASRRPLPRRWTQWLAGRDTSPSSCGGCDGCGGSTSCRDDAKTLKVVTFRPRTKPNSGVHR